MMHYLYRNSRRRTIAIALACWLMGVFCSAQIRDRTQHDAPPPDDSQTRINAKKTTRGPRAIAVVEFLPGGGTRLVPIALWIDDHFYDASLYGANPAPMALEPETLYEATDYGESAGFFTVTTPHQLKGTWVADGKWKARLALDDKLARKAAQQPELKPTLADPADDRPRLHRRGSSGGGSSAAGDSGSASSPTAASGSASSAPATVTPDPTEPPDRPTLKKSSPPPSTASIPSAGGDTAASSAAETAATATVETNAPGRPVLRRGAPPQSTGASDAASVAAAESAAAAEEASPAKLMTTLASLGRRSYPAVSDAGKYETRSMLYAISSAERSEKSQQMRALAMTEIRHFISQRNTPALPKTAALTDYDLRGFDLDYSNSPTLVFTAILPVGSAKALGGGAFDYFVTLVAREDVNGTPIKIFSAVTDSNHLDAFSRMEIVDAVDADANGRGDLLFRQYSDTGVNYSLFRVYPYEMRKVFEGGSGV